MSFLLSGYPSLKSLHDPEGYIANLASLLTGYSHEDAVAGVKQCANHGGEFPPSRFTLRQACEQAVGRRLWLERLRAVPDPAPRIATTKPVDPPPGPDGKHPPGTILTNFGAAAALYGRPIGRFESNREKP